jgi:hypothetical protein
MEAEDQKGKKRCHEDFVSFVACVQRRLLYVGYSDSSEEDSGEEQRLEDNVDEQVDYKCYRVGGYKEQTLGDVLTPAWARSVGIRDGRFSVSHKKDAAWGRKSTQLSLGLPLRYVAQYHLDDQGRCELMVKPRRPLYYECVRLTAEEVEAARDILKECRKRRKIVTSV